MMKWSILFESLREQVFVNAFSNYKIGEKFWIASPWPERKVKVNEVFC